jgi:hypothetical protein
MMLGLALPVHYIYLTLYAERMLGLLGLDRNSDAANSAEESVQNFCEARAACITINILRFSVFSLSLAPVHRVTLPASNDIMPPLLLRCPQVIILHSDSGYSCACQWFHVIGGCGRYKGRHGDCFCC